MLIINTWLAKISIYFLTCLNTLLRVVVLTSYSPAFEMRFIVVTSLNYLPDLEAENGLLRSLESSHYDITVPKGNLRSVSSPVVGGNAQSTSATDSAQGLSRYAALSPAVNQCTNCCNAFPNPYDRYMHLISCERFLCRKCSVTLRNYESLKKHVWENHHCIIHRCRDCKYISFAPTDEIGHISMSCELRGQFECEICREEFPSLNQLRGHIMRQHPPNQK